jgi:hypothetical protein
MLGLLQVTKYIKLPMALYTLGIELIFGIYLHQLLIAHFKKKNQILACRGVLLHVPFNILAF